MTGDDEGARRFLTDKAITFPSLSDGEGTVAQAYGVDSTPTAAIVDREGRWIFTHHGFNAAEGVRPVGELLDAALARPPAPVTK